MTTAERSNNIVSALDIYSAYPHGDLLPVEPPDKNMSVRDFLKQVDPPTLSDTLFLFILREVADLDGERGEVVKGLNRAIALLPSTQCRFPLVTHWMPLPQWPETPDSQQKHAIQDNSIWGVRAHPV